MFTVSESEAIFGPGTLFQFFTGGAGATAFTDLPTQLGSAFTLTPITDDNVCVSVDASTVKLVVSTATDCTTDSLSFIVHPSIEGELTFFT